MNVVPLFAGVASPPEGDTTGTPPGLTAGGVALHAAIRAASHHPSVGLDTCVAHGMRFRRFGPGWVYVDVDRSSPVTDPACVAALDDWWTTR